MADDLLSQDEINALLEGTLGSDDDESPGGSLSSVQMDSLNDFAGFFKDAISNVIGMLAGKTVSVSVDAPAQVGQSDFSSELSGSRYLKFIVECDGFDNIPLSMIMSEKGVMMLADLMMGGEGKDLPDEANELFVNASQEGLSQVMGSAMTSLSGRLEGKRAIPSNPHAEMVSDEWLPFEDLSSDESIWKVAIEVSIEGLDPFTCYLIMPVSTAEIFADALSGIEAEPPVASASSQQPQVSSAPAASPQQPKQQANYQQPMAPTPPSGGFSQPPQGYPSPPVDVRPAEFAPLGSSVTAYSEPSNINLIADIPVRVTVELGRTRKSVAEILALAPGSMIELDKMAGEPVDILVNGKPIAKGEVVVIDENFGVRITEILNMDNRVQSVGS